MTGHRFHCDTTTVGTQYHFSKYNKSEMRKEILTSVSNFFDALEAGSIETDVVLVR